jgi:hypothetical protein
MPACAWRCHTATNVLLSRAIRQPQRKVTLPDSLVYAKRCHGGALTGDNARNPQVEEVAVRGLQPVHRLRKLP